MEKYRERQKDLHLAFLDLEKAYDSVSREYKGERTCVRTLTGNTKYFPVDVGLHQGLAISPYLFALILDELTKRIQESIPWCLVFTDDIVLISETLKGLNGRLEQWRKALEDNGLRVSKEKTEYLRCNFSRNEN
ncbi:retrovirus-related pol polyprotein LINE-1, partial [Tanacetum coccineum]